MTLDDGMTIDTALPKRTFDREILKEQLLLATKLKGLIDPSEDRIEAVLTLFKGMFLTEEIYIEIRKLETRIAEEMRTPYHPLSKQCMAKHTKYQPDIAGNLEWQCPKCAATAYDAKPFTTYQSVEDADEECNLLHIYDICVCENCGYQAQGNAVARALAKKHNMVTCPKCSGKGVVKRT